MSRVYSVMTGSSAPRPATIEPHDKDAPFVVEAEDAPFIEIGGPSGPVFSAASGGSRPPLAQPQPVPPLAKPADVKVSAEPVARVFPRIAPTSTATPQAAVISELPATILSVRFHDVGPQTARPLADGPDPSLVAWHFPDHPVSGEYRTLRDEIAKQLPEATSRVLVFTAAVMEAGTTTVLLNLGITLAREGWRVLVVDANFTRPGATTKLALRPSPGLAEVLGQQLPLPWALQPTVVPSLQALAAGVPTATTAASVGHDFTKLVGQLRQWFDWVLVDAGAWGVLPERDATCPVADAVYLVTREADSERPEFIGLRAWVKELGGTLRGYVTTKV